MSLNTMTMTLSLGGGGNLGASTYLWFISLFSAFSKILIPILLNNWFSSVLFSSSRDKVSRIFAVGKTTQFVFDNINLKEINCSPSLKTSPLLNCVKFISTCFQKTHPIVVRFLGILQNNHQNCKKWPEKFSGMKKISEFNWARWQITQWIHLCAPKNKRNYVCWSLVRCNWTRNNF